MKTEAEIRAEIERWIVLKEQAHAFCNGVAFGRAVERIETLEWVIATTTPQEPPNADK